MKNVLLMTLVLVIAITLMSGVALAGGWTSISYTESHDPNDNFTDGVLDAADGVAIWNANQDPGGYDGSGKDSPHGGFSASTNRCRVCHAVHMAGANSWRLLQDGTNVGGEDRGMDRASECNFCHGVTGVTNKRPYRPKDYDVLGEHTIGSTVIPDSNSSNAVAGGLSCGNCHTVHGGGDFGDASETLAITTWDNKILKVDPNGDGSELGADATGAASISQLGTDADAVKSNFCGDCHNENPNWNTTEDPADSPNSSRVNGRSHVQGPTAEGSLEVYGTTMTVAGWGTIAGNGVGTSNDQDTKAGCRGCHAASNAGNNTADITATASAFPHQTAGAKLLFDTFTEDNAVQQTSQTGGWGGLTNDADRILPNMDQLCGKCHIKGGDIDSAVEGVGQTF